MIEKASCLQDLVLQILQEAMWTAFWTAFWFTPIQNYLEFSHPSLLQLSLGHLYPTPSL